MKMNVFELYSGIGGMHMALKESGTQGEIKASVDINNTANKIYSHNFPNTPLLNKNIQGLTPSVVRNLEIDTILMSPPCQPFTRNGLQADLDDPRTDSFVHLLSLLPELDLKRMLVENVKGFEGSKMRDKFIEVLTRLGFGFQEFLLSPSQIGVPNTRLRYYCLAKKQPDEFCFTTTGALMMNFPHEILNSPYSISSILEDNVDEEKYSLSDETLRKRIFLLDITHAASIRSCCFTKAYGRYIEGTGSVFTVKTEEETRAVFNRLENMDPKSEEFIELARSLKLRYFTPKEVSRLMSFPEYFSFPDGVSDRQCYMVLGNSVNVKVISELIKLLR